VERIAEQGRIADTVFIGSQAPEGALAWMMRPIDPLHVLRELDIAVSPQAVDPRGPRALPSRRSSDLPPPARSVPPEVLVVDDDEASARPLERELQALGVSVARVNTSGKALELMSRLSFRCIFVAVDLGPASEMDGLALCQHIQRQPSQGGGERPAVFLMSIGGGADRVRGTLAGCDAFLTKPIDDVVLRRLLAAHGTSMSRPGPSRALQR